MSLIRSNAERDEARAHVADLQQRLDAVRAEQEFTAVQAAYDELIRRELARAALGSASPEPPCDTCSGTRIVAQQGIRGAAGSGADVACPDCTDRKPAIHTAEVASPEPTTPLCPCGHGPDQHHKIRSDGGPPFCDVTLSSECGCQGYGCALAPEPTGGER